MLARSPVCCVVFLLLLSLPGISIAEKPAESSSGNAAASGITALALRRDLGFLASDDLRGRSVTDDTIQVAADYLARRMGEIGLQTDSYDGTPFQAVDVPVGNETGAPDKNNATFRITRDDEGVDEVNVTLRDGFSPLAVGADDGAVSAPLVFAGYGITAPKIGYDDYAGIDAKGAVVMILRKEPQLSDPDSPFGGTENSQHAYFQTKIANAIEHGALAVLIVNDPKSIEEAVQAEEQRIEQEKERQVAIEKQLSELPAQATKNQAALKEKIAVIDGMLADMQRNVDEARRGVLGLSEAGTKNNKTKSMPVASIARDVAVDLLKRGGNVSLTEIEASIDRDLKPQSHELESIIASVMVNIKPAVAETFNVVGVYPGKGPLANETIVVGAHYDHVGMGGYGSLAPGTIAIHNGADDNASGTATMLSIAQTVTGKLETVTSHRTLVFIGFTGEERGLIGSQFYVDHPLRELKQTAAMVNLDMVGRLRDNELTVYGTGSADKLEAVVDAANQKQEFNLYKVASGYGPSDHQSFYTAGVPVLFFFTGLHNDYHRPTDDFDKIDFGNLTRITDMVSDVTLQLSVLPERPRYAETEQKVQIRRQMTAYLGVTLSDGNGSVMVSSIYEDGPAEAGGVQVGDVLQRMGKTRIRSSDDVLSWLRDQSPGNEVVVRVLRAGKTVNLNVKLGNRPGN
ncbi:M28 family peptidase [Stieleria varia]|uniref:Aminopeptidase YwaD n=1 Tax=Stieleria varia TaxID=2528005 RepID=A0A5C5ZM61_9BACT|nr:M28 family peptidase [Stieleria varia]TWT87931.1 Aminopeptidase YwaD precursor [Stieleria varia]